MLIAVGAHLNRPLSIPGIDLKGVFQGVSFLRSVSLGERPTLGKRVIVIGGGNVAMDAVRTALRLGAEEAMIIYRRSEDEMPARREEIEGAREEGVVFRMLANPVRIIGDEKGWVKALECIKMELGEPDGSGRRSPVEVEGSEYILDAETVITAVGQGSDNACLKGCKGFMTTRWGTIVTDESLNNVGIPGVFAAGDVATGPGIVIGAAASGQKAARSIDNYLRGSERRIERRARMTPLKNHRQPEGYIKIKREESLVRDEKERLKGIYSG